MIVRSTMSTNDADDDGRHHQHCDPDAEAVAGSDDRRIAAEHQEFPMCENDDPHHAENNRQPDADQRLAIA
jgi:hypothetical protein